MIRLRFARLGALVRHTDGMREDACDREAAIGRLDKTLDTAALDSRAIVNMKRDWRSIFSAKQQDRMAGP